MSPLTAQARDEPLVDREAQLAALQRFRAHEGDALLLLTGDAGIGKTVLLWTAARAAQAEGWLVLSAAPTEAETALSFAALADLFAAIPDEALRQLEPPLRDSLETALLRREPEGPAPNSLAIGMAVVSLLRQLAERSPVLLVVDDAHWLDQPSAAALAFALRRTAPERMRTLMTCRADQHPAGPLASTMEGARSLVVEPLTLAATSELLRQRLGAGIPAAVVRRIHESTDGNPLHVLQLAQAGAEEPLPGAAMFPPPRQLADLVRQRLGRLAPSACEILLAVAAMSRPTVDVLHELRPSGIDADIAAAVGAGLLVVDAERVRFAHPLFASACYRAASPRARRQVHRRLAAALNDPEERARHLALGAEAPQSRVAEELDAAAHHARARGGVDAAADLMLRARDFTTNEAAGLRAQRARMAARYLLEAGDSGRAFELLKQLADDSTTRTERARNLVALSAVAYEVVGTDLSRSLSLRAMDEAGDDPLALADALLSFAERSHETVHERLAHATTALRLLEGNPESDPAVMARALREVALSQYHLGRGMPRELMDRAGAIERSLLEPLPLTWRARTCLGECLKYVDAFFESRAILAETAKVAQELGDVIALSGTLAHQAELELWLGNWDEADACARRSAELAAQSDQVGRLPFAVSGRLLVAACRGDVDRARGLGREALTAARRAQDRWSAALVHAAIGQAELAAGASAAAVAALRQTDAFMDGPLLTAPRQWRHLGDYVEALIATGDVDLATDRLRRLEQWAAMVDTSWCWLTAAFARGLVLEARGDRAAAVTALEEASNRAEQLPLPFVQARCWFAAGDDTAPGAQQASCP